MQPVLEHQKPRHRRATSAAALMESLNWFAPEWAASLLKMICSNYLRHVTPNRNAIPATIASVV
jgi:hypothetical protein